MKTIRSVMTLAGFSVMLFALATVGARGQGIYSTHFLGTFTLPFEAQWGTMTLPPGNYTLEYGTQESGARRVAVGGMTKGSPHGVILAGPGGDTAGTKNAIVCIRNGDSLVVRALEMPAIRESVKFALPRSTRLVARNGKHNGYTQLAEAPMLIQRIPVTRNAK